MFIQSCFRQKHPSVISWQSPKSHCRNGQPSITGKLHLPLHPQYTIVCASILCLHPKLLNGNSEILEDISKMLNNITLHSTWQQPQLLPGNSCWKRILPVCLMGVLSHGCPGLPCGSRIREGKMEAAAKNTMVNISLQHALKGNKLETTMHLGG